MRGICARVAAVKVRATMDEVLANQRDCLTESRAVRVVAAAVASTERQAIEHHLADCTRCRGLMSEVLRDTGGEQIADRLRPRVLQPGMVLSDRYRIRGFLGLGAMGEVHQAEDLLLGKVVALKTLNARLLGSATAVARFKREVAAAHRVTHPNVCRIFDLGIDCADEAVGPLMFITMEFIEGRTLASLIDDPTLDLGDRTEILRQLASGLASAHVAGVIHRDLKPENVMVTRRVGESIRAVITDFGLAGSGFGEAPEQTREPGLSGTPVYAAPERLVGEPATAASDIYSFGLVAAEVLLRRRSLRLNAHPDLAAIPAPWRKLIARALARTPTGRFADGAELVAALEHWDGRGWKSRQVVVTAGLVTTAGLFLALGSAAPVARPDHRIPTQAAETTTSTRVPPSASPTISPAPEEPPRTSMSKSSRAGRPRRATPSVTRASLEGVTAPQPSSTAPPTGGLVRDVTFDPRPKTAADLLNPF